MEQLRNGAKQSFGESGVLLLNCYSKAQRKLNESRPIASAFGVFGTSWSEMNLVGAHFCGRPCARRAQGGTTQNIKKYIEFKNDFVPTGHKVKC